MRRISALKPIPGADRVCAAVLDGWQVVVAVADGFKVGDLVVYFEIDSFLPAEVRLSYHGLQLQQCSSRHGNHVSPPVGCVSIIISLVAGPSILPACSPACVVIPTLRLTLPRCLRPASSHYRRRAAAAALRVPTQVLLRHPPDAGGGLPPQDSQDSGPAQPGLGPAHRGSLSRQ